MALFNWVIRPSSKVRLTAPSISSGQKSFVVDIVNDCGYMEVYGLPIAEQNIEKTSLAAKDVGVSF